MRFIKGKSGPNFVEKRSLFNFACKCGIIDDRFQMRFKYIVNIPNLHLGQKVIRWGLFLSHNTDFFLGSMVDLPPGLGV